MDHFSDNKSKTYLNTCHFVFEQIVSIYQGEK